MTNDQQRGAVAAGHPATAEAAREILAEGGNAFDAAVGAFFAACVAEPLMTSLLGGGFLLARLGDGGDGGERLRVYDFFAHTPLAKRPAGEVDFYPITSDFGGAEQIFHIGLGSIATPGAVKGVATVHRELGSLPWARLIEPAVALAREGVAVGPIQDYGCRVLEPIVNATPSVKRLFVEADENGALIEGQRFRLPEMAGVLEQLGREGERYLYGGDLGHALIDACRDGGGHLTMDDLARYEVRVRPPLRFDYRGHRLAINPAPSVGGVLIALTLESLEDDRDALPWGTPAHLEALLHALEASERARREHDVDQLRDAETQRQLLAHYRRARAHPLHKGGTTHLSVVDGAGNVAAMSLSNGEGCGWAIPGTGIMPNNMLGEDDLLPDGLGAWPPGRRMASMMAPALVERDDGALLALGSGGSSRIRSAMVQVLSHVLDGGLDLAAAVERPRFHFERGRLDVEPGLPAELLAALRRRAPECRVWEHTSLFFGGVHAVLRDRRGRFAGAGDPRRDGRAHVVGAPEPSTGR